MPTCPNCPWEIRESDRFCANDGTPLVQAHFPIKEIRTYVAADQPLALTLPVVNVGANPLQIELRSTSSQIAVPTEAAILMPNQQHDFPLAVDLDRSTVRGYVEICSNESHPTLLHIPVEVSRPPELELALDPPQLFLGEAWSGRLVVSHAKGGVGVIRTAFCQEDWAQVAGEPNVVLSLGEERPFSVAITLPDQNEGTHEFHVVLDLEGLGKQTYPVSFEVRRRPHLKPTPIRVENILPGRVRRQVTTVENESDEPITIVDVGFEPATWLRKTDSLRLPIHLEPHEMKPVEVEITTRGLPSGKQTGQILLYWNKGERTAIPVTVQVTAATHYRGYAGVDFGTTNSCVCVSPANAAVRTEKVVPLDFDHGEPVYSIPTAIYYPDQDLSRYVIGKAAAEAALLPDLAPNTVLQVKRMLGQAQPLTIQNQAVSPTRVVADILRGLLDKAEDYCGQLIKRAVVTVPASYSSRQIMAMLEACRLAGLEVDTQSDPEAVAQAIADEELKLLDEPLAAAMDYIHQPEAKDLQEGNFMIYDFGGGTLDISLLHVKRDASEQKTDLQVLDVEGRRIGGEDLTAMLVDEIAAQLKAKRGWTDQDLPYKVDSDEYLTLSPERQDQVRRNRTELARVAELIKIELSTRDESVDRTLKLVAGQTPAPVNEVFRMTRSRFQELIGPVIDRTLEPVEEALTMGKLKAGQLNRIVLTGGSSNIPLVAETLSRLGTRVEKASPARMKECVAYGAFRMGTYWAGLGASNITTSGIHNKTNYRYGIVAAPNGEEDFVEIIPKGIDLPTPWFEYPRPDSGESFTVKERHCELTILRNRTIRADWSTDDVESVNIVTAEVPEARPRNPVAVRIEMMMDLRKLLHVRILAGSQEVDSQVTDL